MSDMTGHQEAVLEALEVARRIVARLVAAAAADDLASLHVATIAHLARQPDDGKAMEWGITGEHTVTIRYSLDSEQQAFVDKARAAVHEQSQAGNKPA